MFGKQAPQHGSGTQVQAGNRKATADTQTDRKGRCCAGGDCDHRNDAGSGPSALHDPKNPPPVTGATSANDDSGPDSG